MFEGRVQRLSLLVFLPNSLLPESLISILCRLFPPFNISRLKKIESSFIDSYLKNRKFGHNFYTNSFLFQLTGLLEVGLYRLLEYTTTSSTASSSCAMVRATAAILRLFEHLLPHEHMVVNLVRRAALVVPHLRQVLFIRCGDYFLVFSFHFYIYYPQSRDGVGS